MTEERALQVADSSAPPPMTLQEVKNQVGLIHNILKEVMKSGEHYGTIPGCGDKPTLLKSGAEKLCMTFRLAPDIDVEVVDLSTGSLYGHREYRVKTVLYSPTGQRLGSGVGSCSTMEGKYRYRTQSTGKEVPSKYWESRDAQLLGGSQYSTRKVGGKWMIMEQIEHGNPYDYYNTCLKMAKKRSLVDAILTTTAASDIFTQDIEDMDIGQPDVDEKPKKADTVKPAQKQETKKPEPKEPDEVQMPEDAGEEESEYTGEPSYTAQQMLYRKLAIHCGLDKDTMNKILKDISKFKGSKGDVFMTLEKPDKWSDAWVGKSMEKLDKRIKEQEHDYMPDDCGQGSNCDHAQDNDKTGTTCDYSGLACPYGEILAFE